ncbi:hypothetical protein Ltuc_2899 [Legionella tucsonensis]|uniref:Uncharacterized protein n=1 Tax=Legionella tucsonensis TaxID=40335 RepID=A0A0W0ZPG2_9GAMM|nr:hypothetical protein Ltuc_2899 [Legionella tucsonensis]
MILKSLWGKTGFLEECLFHIDHIFKHVTNSKNSPNITLHKKEKMITKKHTLKLKIIRTSYANLGILHFAFIEEGKSVLLNRLQLRVIYENYNSTFF